MATQSNREEAQALNNQVMPLSCRLGFHTWSKWKVSAAKQDGAYQWQYQDCLKCDKKKVKHL